MNSTATQLDADPIDADPKNPSLFKYRLVAAALLISIAVAIFSLGKPPRKQELWTRSIDLNLSAQSSMLNIGPSSQPISRPNIGSKSVVVPRLFQTSLPADLATWTVSERKRVFVETVLPLVLYENERIQNSRGRLVALANQSALGRHMATADSAWLAGLSSHYRVRMGDWAELLRRVDTVPPSLAIAQAAEESGWGTSRFARQGNALFGQWTFTPGAGMVPTGRDQGALHEVKSFQVLLHSVRDYAKNLNTHRAYGSLRQMRAGLRLQDRVLSGYELSTALSRYSSRGEDYVLSLQNIIRVNNLDRLDEAQLGDHKLAALDP